MRRRRDLLAGSAAGVLLGLVAVGATSAGRPDPLRPDPRLTPGDTVSVSIPTLCRAGYSASVRAVSRATKQEVFRRYHLTDIRGRYEVDHLISLELGGSNRVTNLWPESYVSSPWNAHVKDRLENALHRDVCQRTLRLHDAQRMIATDWIHAYRVTLGPWPGRS